MLRTVMRHTSVVRLRPVMAWRAGPCCIQVVVSSWSAAPITAANTFPRCFSVATTDETTLLQVDTDTDDVDKVDSHAKNRSKKKKMKQRDFPSKKKARRLFDEVAPHLPLETLKTITRKLKNNASNIAEIETRVVQVRALLEMENIPPWAQQRLTEFLLDKKFDQHQHADSFPVNVNKASLETHVDMLMHAQDLAAQKPPLWSNTQRQKIARGKKSAEEEQQPDDDASASSDDSQPSPEAPSDDALTIHKSKTKETRRKEAEDLALLLAERLPEKSFLMLMDLFASYAKEATNTKRPKLRMLYSNLIKCVPSHIHFIAEEVAVFFYVSHSTHGDPRVQERKKKWETEEETFVNTMLEIYKGLETPPPTKQARGLINDNLDTLHELDKLRTRPSDGVKVGRDRKKEQARHGRRRKNVHLIFDAVMLQDEWTVTTTQQSQHITFVDNLPIDMDETDLIGLFSRCGPVQSVKIYNQREELDPGPLSAKKKREHKIKYRQSMSRNRHRWKRPRTPVYAQINFASQEGHDTAVDAPLRIFGMVVRKHPMRTIRMDDMTSLYLEDIPEGMYSLDIEHKLSKLLHPQIYVCLDVGQHDFAEPSSCEIKFPSFPMAYHAYQKLQELDIEGVSLQWMRTPEDAMKFWTREYSFET